jgi:predicted NAD-dependent protein-ADP-ribosyltransferase YbiA (DUF1768 family)
LPKDLAALGRALAKDGKPVTEAAEQQTMVNELIQKFTTTKLPLLKTWGGVQ